MAGRRKAAAPAQDQAAPADAVEAARRTWADVRTLNAEVWPAVDNAESGWLVRLTTPDRLVQPRLVPLARDFRAAAREQRRKAEDEVLTLLRTETDVANEDAADRLLQAIQRAKSADLDPSLDIKPEDLKALKPLLGDAVYLFVEILALRDVQPPAGQPFCGVAIYRTGYSARPTERRPTDRYVAKMLRPAANPEELIRAALAPPGPPLQGNGQIRADAHLIVAPDGVPPSGWFAFERDMLLRPLELKADNAGWLVYVPSAGAIGSSHWSLEETLRAWYRVAARTQVPPPLFTDATPLAIRRNAGPPLDSRLLGMGVFRVWLEAGSPRPEEPLLDFLTAQRESTTRVMPLWVSPPPRRP